MPKAQFDIIRDPKIRVKKKSCSTRLSYLDLICTVDYIEKYLTMLLYDIGSTNPLMISAKVSADTLAL